MTEAMDWLKSTQGIQNLTDGESSDAIRDFGLLWGLFEGTAMATRGSQQAIVAAVGTMTIPTSLPDAFVSALAFWRDQYWQGGEKTYAFDALNFAENPHRTLALTVLSGENMIRRRLSLRCCRSPCG